MCMSVLKASPKRAGSKSRLVFELSIYIYIVNKLQTFFFFIYLINTVIIRDISALGSTVVLDILIF